MAPGSRRESAGDEAADVAGGFTGAASGEVAALLGLGSNLGDRRAHLAYGLSRLAEETRLTAVSSVFETEPVGGPDQPAYLNLVARVATPLAPHDLLAVARRIEEERGRRRPFPNAPRTLDIDLLLVDDLVLDTPDLVIPHPRMTERAFVLVPLLELEPDRVHPVTGERLRRFCPDAAAGAVRRRAPGRDLLQRGRE